MAHWFGLMIMIILIVISLCWVPDNDREKKEKRYQRFKSMKEKQEEQEEFERRYKIEKNEEERQSYDCK